MATMPQTSLSLLYHPLADRDYRIGIQFYGSGMYGTKFKYFNYLFNTLYNFDDVRPDMDNIWYHVNLEYEDCRKCNYCYFTTGMDITYYFITDVQRVGDNVTKIFLECDVWTTYSDVLKINPCMVERSHIDRWDSTGKAISFTNTDLPANADKIVSEKLMLEQHNGSYIIWIGVHYIEKSTSYLDIKNMNQYGNLVQSLWMPVQINNIAKPTLYNNCEISGIKKLAGWIDDPRIVSIQLCAYKPFKGLGEAVSLVNTSFPADATLKGIRGKESDIFASNIVQQSYTFTPKVFDQTPGSLHPLTTARQRGIDPILNAYPYAYYKFKCNNNENIVRATDITQKVGSSYQNSLNVYVTATADMTSITFSVDSHKKDVSGASDLTKTTTEFSADFTQLTDAWLNYMNANKASINSGRLVRGATMAAGLVAGGIATVATGGTALPYFIGAGAATISSFAGSIAQEQLSYSNMMETPDSIDSASSNALAEFSKRSYAGAIKMQRWEISDSELTRVDDFYYRNGYKILEVKADPVATYKTRYYFNYIKLVDPVITLTSGNSWKHPQHREKLKKIFEDGITVRHYRNALIQPVIDFINGNFYAKENTEMSLYEVM